MTARMMRSPSVHDLTAEEREVYVTLRGFADVLMLAEEATLSDYQKRLRRLHALGIINLHRGL